MAATTPQSDPNVRVPAAVRMAAERASQLHAAEYQTEDPADKEEGKKDDEKLVVLADPPKIEAKKEIKTEVQDAPVVTQPDAKVTQTGKAVTEEAYNALKGRWDQAQAHMRTMSAEMNDLKNQIATLTAQLEAPHFDPGTSAENLLTDKEKEDFGAEFLDVAGRRAREVITPEISAMRKEITELRGKLTTVEGSTKAEKREIMHSQIGAAVPSWKETNTNPEFIAWLGLPDTYSGAIRQDLLKQAYDRNDATRVIAFFKGFLAEEAALTPAVPAQTDQGKVSLADLAAPGRPKTATTVPAKTAAASQIITRAEIARFYADVAAGRYRDKETQRAELEAQIFQAQSEGRISD